jgi:hypothetical protein
LISRPSLLFLIGSDHDGIANWLAADCEHSSLASDRGVINVKSLRAHYLLLLGPTGGPASALACHVMVMNGGSFQHTTNITYRWITIRKVGRLRRCARS